MSDDARDYSDSTKRDLSENDLGRAAFAQKISSVIELVGRGEESTVLGLIGPWGSGKSTVMDEALRTLRESSTGWVVAEFNPWFYQDLAALQLGFFRELSSALPLGKGRKKARKQLAEWVETVAPFGAVGGVVGADMSAALNKVADTIKGGQSARAVKASLENELRVMESPVLVVIDDVDRLHPEELLLLFKLIRLAGRLPNVHYLLAFDEDTLLDALQRTGLIGSDVPRRAIDYMEKIVQIRLDVPPVRDVDLDQWVNRELEELAQRRGLGTEPDFERRFTAAYFAHIRDRLATPRAVRRFFDQVDVFAQEVVGEVDSADFLILSWLRAAEPLVYRAIIDHRENLVSERGGQSASSGNDTSHTLGATYWQGLLKDAHVDPRRTQGVASVLGQLFPRFHAEWNDGDITNFSPAAGRVAHPDYFDRFFEMGVPADDIQDSLVRIGCGQIVAGEEGEERRLVEREWLREPARLIVKLRQFWGTEDTDIIAVLRWLTVNAALLSPSDSIIGTRSEVVWFAQRLFLRLEGDDPELAVHAMAHVDTELAFVSDVLFITSDPTAPPEARAPRFADAHLAYSVYASELLESLGGLNPLQYPPQAREVFHRWRMADPDSLRDWVNLQPDRKWPLLDLLGMMIHRIENRNGQGSEARLAPFDYQAAFHLMGADFVMDELSSKIATFDEDLPSFMPDTPDDRRKQVLYTLRNMPR